MGGEYSPSNGANIQTAAATERRSQCHLPWTSDGCGRGGEGREERQEGEREEVEMEGGVAHGLLPWQ